MQELPPLQLFAARLLLPMLQQRLLALDLQAGTHRGVWHVHGAGGEGVWRDAHGAGGSEGVWRVHMRVVDVPA